MALFAKHFVLPWSLLITRLPPHYPSSFGFFGKVLISLPLGTLGLFVVFYPYFWYQTRWTWYICSLKALLTWREQPWLHLAASCGGAQNNFCCAWEQIFQAFLFQYIVLAISQREKWVGEMEMLRRSRSLIDQDWLKSQETDKWEHTLVRWECTCFRWKEPYMNLLNFKMIWVTSVCCICDLGCTTHMHSSTLKYLPTVVCSWRGIWMTSNKICLLIGTNTRRADIEGPRFRRNICEAFFFSPIVSVPASCALAIAQGSVQSLKWSPRSSSTSWGPFTPVAVQILCWCWQLVNHFHLVITWEEKPHTAKCDQRERRGKAAQVRTWGSTLC